MMEERTTFYHKIQKKYGKSVKSVMKKYSSNLTKLARLKSQRIFLLKCRHDGVFPKHIIDATKAYNELIINHTKWTNRIHTRAQKARKMLLNLEIDITVLTIKDFEEATKRSQITINSSLKNAQTYHRFITSQEQKYCTQYNRSKNGLVEKFKRITSNNNIDIICDQKVLINHTNVTLPTDVVTMLSLGPKFSVPFESSEFPVDNIISEIESAIQVGSQDFEKQDITRAKSVNVLSNYLHSRQFRSGNRMDNHMNALYESTRKYLRDHKELTVLQADKGGATVVMLTTEYFTKMNELVADQNVYQKIAKDPTNKYQNKNNALARLLLTNHHIDKQEKNRLLCNNASIPKIYGAPKVHKTDMPMRPVVASFKAPNRNMARKLCRIVSKAVDVDMNIKNSYEFKKFIDEVTVPDGYVLVSFDVISLFTNITVERLTYVITKKWDIIRPHTDIPLDLFIKLVKFCIDECNVFSFQNEIFRQKKGTAMGNPFSAVGANLVMDDLISVVMSSMDRAQTIFIKKYVDDLIALVRKDDIELLSNALNKYDDDIQFTHEVELNNEISYLDLKLVRVGSHIITDWYRKELASGRMLDYLSQHSMPLKINTAKSLVNRVFTLSSECFHESNRKIVHSILAQNHYPDRLITNMINSHFRMNMTETPIANKPEDIKFVSFTYATGLAERLKKIMRKQLPNVQISFKPLKKVKDLHTRLKDRENENEKAGVVYEVQCESCDTVYIGQTGRMVTTRMKEHTTDMSNALKHLADSNNNNTMASTQINSQAINSCNRRPVLHKLTALKQHVMESGHKFNTAEYRILRSEDNTFKRSILEALCILREPNACNHRTDANGISSIYSAVITNTVRNPV